MCPRRIFELTLMGLTIVLKQKIAYYTFTWLKTSKGYFGPFFIRFLNQSSFRNWICSRLTFARIIMGLPGVTLIEIAYYTFEWRNTSEIGYFGPFFEDFSF